MHLESKRKNHYGFLLDRRRALHLLGGAGAAVFLGRGNLVTVDAADLRALPRRPPRPKARIGWRKT